MKSMTIDVNGLEWTEKATRVHRSCEGCGKPTRGRIEKKPFCIDCGMKRVMEPIRSVKSILHELFK
jgi:hypothetical protein